MATAVSGGAVQAASIAAGPLSVVYDLSSQSYTLSAPGGSETFHSSDIGSGGAPGQVVYSKPNGDQLTLINASPSSGAALNYVGLGVWQAVQTSGGVQTTAYNTFDYGIPTPASAAPRTGEAAYNVDLIGYLAVPGSGTKSLTGPGVFEADFLSGLFKADIFPVVKDLTTGAGNFGGGIELVAVGDLSGSDGSFSGQASFLDGINTPYYVGPISGRLYGPAGQEVGASFTGDNPNGGTMAGSFVGAQTGSVPNENLTLTNIYAQQLFYAASVKLETDTDTSGNYSGLTYVANGQLTLHTDGSMAVAGMDTSLQYATFTLSDIVAPALPNFTTYKTTANGFALEFDVYNVGPGNTELALTYMDLGIWRQDATIPPQNGERTVYSVWGIQTPQGVLLRQTGTAQYSGVVYGGDVTSGGQYDLTGTSSLVVNFPAQTITGSMTLTGVLEGAGSTRNIGTLTFSGPLDPTSTLEGSTLQVSQGGAGVGQLQLEFFGPSAQEVGGPFSVQLGNTGVYGTPYSDNIAGVVAAKRH